MNDAKLIAACGAFIAAKAEFYCLNAGYADDDTPNAAWDARLSKIEADLEWLFDVICDTRATTPAGARSKAAALRAWTMKSVDGGPAQRDDNLAWSLACDVHAITNAHA